MFNTTLAPLPSWREICKAIFIRKPEDKIIANPWLSRPSDIPYWFSRSSVSIYIIVSWWIKYTDKKKPIIWIPDYFCNESLIWLRGKIDCTFHFYKINADFVPDWNHCNDSVTYNKPDIFILVHYFGSPSDGELARQFCNKYHCVLVEDGAHVLIPYKGIGSFGEFTFYSPHKLIAIPDGSVLIHRPKTKVQGIISNKDS